jgi:hypothetical protein
MIVLFYPTAAGGIDLVQSSATGSQAAALYRKSTMDFPD